MCEDIDCCKYLTIMNELAMNKIFYLFLPLVQIVVLINVDNSLNVYIVSSICNYVAEYHGRDDPFWSPNLTMKHMYML